MAVEVWAAVEAMVAERGEGADSSPGGSGVELGVCVGGEKGEGGQTSGEARWQGAVGGAGGSGLPVMDGEATRWIQIGDGDDGTHDG
jgi:hypothetical protein